MLIQRIVRFFSGSRLLRADADIRDAVLDRMLAGGIMFRSAIAEETDGSVTFCLPEKEAKRLFLCLEADGLPIPETVCAHGFPHLFRLYRRRAGLLLGFLIAVALTAFSSQFVWGVKVIGNQSIPAELIRHRLEMYGCAPGSFIPDLDVSAVANNYLIAEDDLVWMSINLYGTVAYVEVKEKGSVADRQDDIRLSNIVADCDGQVMWFSVKDGKGLVNVYDIVEKGQLLVSGIEETTDGTFRLRRADAQVYAKVHKSFHIEIPLLREQKLFTGNTVRHSFVKFFGKTVNLFGNSGMIPEKYDKIEDERILAQFGELPVPVSIVTDIYNEYETVSVSLTEEEARRIGAVQLEDLMTKELADAEILEREVKTDLQENALVIDCRVWCIMDIAREQPVEVSG